MHLVKRCIEALVLIEDGAFEIVLNPPRHDDDGLPGEEEKNAFEQVGQQEQPRLPKCEALHPSQSVLFAIQHRGPFRDASLEPRADPSQRAREFRGSGLCKHFGLRLPFAQGSEERLIHGFHGVDTLPDKARRVDRKDVGEKNEDDASQQQMRILRDVRIQFPELTHAASKLEIPGDRWNDGEQTHLVCLQIQRA